MMTEKQWYAVYTRPRWEKKVSALLDKEAIENFCPLNKVVKKWSDRRKTIYEPLFSCYVFVHIGKTERPSIYGVSGVIRFVQYEGAPAVIRDEEIEVMQDFVRSHQRLAVERIAVNPNDRVRIISGPLMMHEGNVSQVRNNAIRVILPSLGYSITAEVRRDNIEILYAATPADIK